MQSATIRTERRSHGCVNGRKRRRQKNLAGVVERLQTVRKLRVGQDREQRIHRARYAAIARETAILSAQHLSRFDTPRRLATLVVFAREMEAILTDAALAMFDKMLGSVFRRADWRTRNMSLIGRRRSMLRCGRCSAWRKQCWPPRLAERIRSRPWSAPGLGAPENLVAEAEKIVTRARGQSERNCRSLSDRAAHGADLCSTLSCSAHGNRRSRCLPRSTCCANSMRLAEEICRRTRRRRF